jgi:iron complex outermembrane receptor protein
MYGEGATGGVINILTHKKGIGQGGQVGARVGSYGQRETQATLGKEIGDWSLMASGFERHANNHRDNFKSNEQSMLLQGNWRKESNSINLRYASQTLTSGLPGGVNLSDFMNRSRLSYKPQDHGKTTAESWFVGLGGLVSGWNWVSELTHKRKNVESVYVVDGYATLNQTPTNRLGLRAWYKDQMGALESKTLLGFDDEIWTQNRNDGSRIEQKMQAIYGKYELSHRPSGLSGFMGARRTLANKNASSDPLVGITGGINDRNTSADGGLSWLMNQQSELYVYRGNSFRLANSDEYVCYYQCSSNPVNVLAPQKSQDTEVGYKFKTNRWQQTLRAYQHKLTNEIGLDITNFNNVNYDPTVHKGVEWDQMLQLNRQWSVKTQLASRDNRFVSGQYAGQKMPAPENSVQMQLTHAWNKDARLTWATTWFSAQKIVGDFAGTCAEKIPGFATHDVVYFRQMDQWQWTAGIKNLGDKNYYTLRTRCDATAKSVYPEAGRSFFVGGKYLF